MVECAMPLPIAREWFKQRRLDDAVTLIWEPHVIPDIRCNMWLMRGADRDLLIDSGMGLVSLKAHVAAVTERPVLCVASHTHFDHIGGHHEFDDRLIHADEAGILAAPGRRETVIDKYVEEAIFTAAPFENFDAATYALEPAPATRLLADGDVIDLGDRQFSVMHLPGHSPGGIALWEAEKGKLFSGDVVYDGPLYDDLYHSDIPAYIRSMARLRDLPVQTVHGGHWASFGRTRMIELIDGYFANRGVKA